MKKKSTFLFFLQLFFIVAFAQKITYEQIPVLLELNTVETIKSDPTVATPFNFVHLDNSSKGSATYTPIRINSSVNPYSILLNKQNVLAANKDLNLIMLSHRGGSLNGTGAQVLGSYSSNGGTTWDTTNIIYDGTPMGRYPSGVIYNPSGNTDINNAWGVVTGSALNTGGSGWGFDFFAWKKFNNIIAQKYVFQHDNNSRMCRTNMQVAGNNFWITGDAHTDDGSYYTGFNHIGWKGVFNSDNITWTSQIITPSYLINPVTSRPCGQPYSSYAFNEDGSVGYFIHIGLPEGTTRYSYRPIVKKTTDGGTTWTDIADFDFSTLSQIQEMVVGTQADPNIINPQIFYIEDAIVDKNDNLHILSYVLSGYYHPNDINFISYYWNPNNIEGLLFDLYTTNSTWDAEFVDIVHAKKVMFDGVTLDARPQMALSSDGSKVFHTWSDTDPNLSETNEYPNLHISGFDVDTKLTTESFNITENGTYQGSAYLHTTAPQAWKEDTVYKLHNVICEVGTTDSEPINYIYLKGVEVYESDFNNVRITYAVINNIGGSLLVTANGSPIQSLSKITQGTNVILSATPQLGYSIKEWKVNNIVVVGNTSDSLVLNDIQVGTHVTIEFEPVYYTVTYSVVNSNGTLEAAANSIYFTSDSQVQEGTEIFLAATPSSGYRVKEWKINDAIVSGNTSNYHNLTLAQTCNITVEFELVKYIVTYSVIGANGTLEATANSVNVTSGSLMQELTEIGFVASPSSGYRVKEWKLNNAVVSGNTSNEYNYYLTQTSNITVEFEPIKHFVTYSMIDANGTLTATENSVNVTSGSWVQEGAEIDFIVSPNIGYQVKEWKLNGAVVSGNTSNNYSLTLTQTSNITVEFESINHIVTYSIIDANGTLAATANSNDVTSGSLVQEGTEINFTASPSSGYRVKEWILNDVIVSGNTSNNYNLTLAQESNVTVEFELIPANSFIVTYSVVNANGTLSAMTGGVSFSSNYNIEQGESVTFTASPANGYIVKEWTLNSNVVSGNTNNTYTVPDLQQAINVTVEYKLDDIMVAFSVVGSNGNLTATVNDNSINSGSLVSPYESVVFDATPNATYQVKEWKLNDVVVLGNTSNTFTVPNLQQAINVTVEFEPIKHIVTYSVINANGTLAALANSANFTSGSLVQEGTEISFTANPSSGYRVKEWKLNDAIVSGNTSNNYNLTLAQISNVTVEFEPITHIVTYSVINANGTLAASANSANVTSGSLVQEGTEISFTANAGSGYRVKEWKLNDAIVSGNTSNNYYLTLAQISNVTVEFEPITHIVTYSVINANGTLAASANSANVTSGSLVQEGTEIVFTASPSSGYRVKEWKLNDAIVSGNSSNNYNLTLAQTSNVTVEFEPITHIVTYSVINANGTLAASANSAIVTSGSLVQEGTEIVFTANPGSGYRVKEWKLNDVIVSGNISNNYNLTLAQISNVTVEFEPITHIVTYSVINANGTLAASANSANVTSGSLVQEGTEISFTANPSSGYRVKEWKLNDAIVSGNSSNNYNLTLAQISNVTVEFEPITHIVTYSVINANGTLAASANSANVTSGSLVQEGTEISFTANPSSGYRVKEWKLNDAVISGNISTDYNLTLTQVSNVTVEFEPINHIVTYSVINANGTLAASANSANVTSGSLVQEGTEIVFTASPSSGYRVKEWKLNDAIVSGNSSNNYNLTLAQTSNVTVEFEPITHIVTYSVINANGTLAASANSANVTSGSLVQEGTEIVFTASPSNGYRIKEWKLNDAIISGNISNNYNLTLAQTSNVTVEFEPITHIVTYSVINANGTLAASANSANFTSGSLVQEGTEISFTANPSSGYRVKEWKLNDVIVSGNSSNNYNLTLAQISNVTVEFEPITHIVTYSVINANGTLAASANSANVTSGSLVQEGTEISFTANPSSGYRVKEWKLNDVIVSGNSSNNYNLTLAQISNVTVEFEPITHIVTYSVINANGTLAASANSANVTSGSLVQEGTEISFTANPSSGYRVKEWKLNDAIVSGNSSNNYNLTLAQISNVTVEFEPITHIVTYSVINANGTLAALANSANVTSGSLVQEGTEISFTANPSSGYRVKEWKLNDAIVSGNSSNNYNLTLAQISNVTVEFEPITHIVTYSVINANGTLAASANSANFTSGSLVQEGTEISFTANPSSGYRVKEWKLNDAVISGNISNNYNLTLAQTSNVTVEFEPITHIVTYSVINANGTLAASANSANVTSGSLVQEGTEIVFTASPSSGYRVKEWKLNDAIVSGNTSNNYNLTLAQTSNITVEFELDDVMLTYSVVSSNGVLTATIDDVTVNSGTLVSPYKTVVFEATPNATYQVKEWKLNDVVVPGNTSNSFTVINPQQATNVTIEFEPITHIVTYSVTNANGTLAALANSVSVTSGSLVQEGTEISFTANPGSGYRVKEWKLNDVIVSGNISNNYNLTLAQTSNVTVEFELDDIMLTYSVVGGNGTLVATVDNIPIISGSLVSPNKTVVFEATPNTAYAVKEWTLNSNVVTGNTTNNYTIQSLQEVSVVTVEFKPDNVGITDHRKTSINVYPNPSTGIFNVSSDNNYKLDVIDILGKTILRQEIEKGQTTLNLSSFNNGIYFVRFTNDSESFIVKIKKANY